MEYTPKGLIPGALISGGSAVLLALIALGGWLLRRYRKSRRMSRMRTHMNTVNMTERKETCMRRLEPEWNIRILRGRFRNAGF